MTEPHPLPVGTTVRVTRKTRLASPVGTVFVIRYSIAPMRFMRSGRYMSQHVGDHASAARWDCVEVIALPTVEGATR